MRIAVIGGGPAGLYFSVLSKQLDPTHDITVYERNPAGSTYGWGVTYSSGLLKKLGRIDPKSPGLAGADIRIQDDCYGRSPARLDVTRDDHGTSIDSN